MKKQLIIEYEWWSHTGNIAEEHKEILEEEAQTAIFELLNNNYTSGDLEAYLYDEKSDLDILYTGHWFLTVKTI